LHGIGVKIMSVIFTTGQDQQLDGGGAAGERPISSAARQALEQSEVRPTTPRGGAGGAHAYMYRYLWTMRV